MLTVMDQGASSASNFAVAFLIAHSSTAHLLGTFAVVQTTYVLTQSIVRSLTSDCLLTRRDSDEVMPRYESAGFLSAFCCALVAAVVLLGVGAAFSSDLRVTFITLAVAFPLLACQDFARYIGITRYNPLYAVWLDTAWLVLFLVAYVVLRERGFVSMPWIFGEWSATGALVGLYALWNHLVIRNQRNLIAFWARSERAVAFRFAGESLLQNAWTYVAVYLLIVIFSLSEVGEIKLAQLVIAPTIVVLSGISTSMVAVASRYFATDAKKALRFVIGVAIAIAAVCLLWTLAVYSVPTATMTKLLGPAWPNARQLVPLTGIGMAAMGFGGMLGAGLRSMRAAKKTFRLSLASLPSVFVLSLGGGVIWGVRAALAGAAIGYAVFAVAALVLLIQTAHRFDPSVESVPFADAAQA